MCSLHWTIPPNPLVMVVKAAAAVQALFHRSPTIRASHRIAYRMTRTIANGRQQYAQVSAQNITQHEHSKMWSAFPLFCFFQGGAKLDSSRVHAAICIACFELLELCSFPSQSCIGARRGGGGGGADFT